MGPKQCLICYEEVPDWVWPGSSSTSKSKEKNETEQLRVIFLLQNLLKIPSSFCEKYLSTQGNPTDWINTCSRCQLLIKEAFFINSQVKELMQKLDELSKHIRKEVKESFKPKLPSPDNNVLSSISNELREFVYLNENNDSKTKDQRYIQEETSITEDHIPPFQESSIWSPSEENDPLMEVIIKNEIDVDNFEHEGLENSGFVNTTIHPDEIHACASDNPNSKTTRRATSLRPLPPPVENNEDSDESLAEPVTDEWIPEIPESRTNLTSTATVKTRRKGEKPARISTKKLNFVSYTLEKQFDTLEQANAMMSTSKQFVFRTRRVSKSGTKLYYYCKQSRKCSAKMYLQLMTESTRVQLFASAEGHDYCQTNVKKRLGIPDETKEEIDRILELGIRRPGMIVTELQLRKVEPPTRIMITNYLNYKLSKRGVKVQQKKITTSDKTNGI